MALETGYGLFVGVEFLCDQSKVGDDLGVDCIGGLRVLDVAVEAVYAVAFVIVLEHLANSVVFLNRGRLTDATWRMSYRKYAFGTSSLRR